MKSQHVIIIGCGHVGSALGASLAADGHDVAGTTTKTHRVDELRGLGITAEVVELTEVDRVKTLLVDRDTIYLTIAPRIRGDDYQRVYVDGVTNLLAAVEGTPVRRIIYTSSTRVYGQDDGSWVDESSPTIPKDAKSKALLEAERALLDPAGKLGISTTVLRLCGIHGPGRDLLEHIRKYCGAEREDGDQFVNMIHIDDIVAALKRLLVIPHHGALNLADDHPDTRRTYFGRILEKAGLDAIRWIDAQNPSLGKRVRNDLIKQTLNLTLRHPKH
jgi:nucleoside-diphosphate-sugar epimerase